MSVVNKIAGMLITLVLCGCRYCAVHTLRFCSDNQSELKGEAILNGNLLEVAVWNEGPVNCFIRMPIRNHPYSITTWLEHYRGGVLMGSGDVIGFPEAESFVLLRSAKSDVYRKDQYVFSIDLSEEMSAYNDYPDFNFKESLITIWFDIMPISRSSVALDNIAFAEFSRVRLEFCPTLGKDD